MVEVSVTYSDWGLANRIGNVIILNRNLKNYPNLHKTILDHELKHDPSKFVFNLDHDWNSLFEDGLVNLIAKTIFMFKHPKSLVQLSPIWIYKNRIYFDLTMDIIYMIIALMFYLRFWW